MIFYYSSGGVGAQIFNQNLNFFLQEEIKFFEYSELEKRSCDLLIIHDDNLHHQQLKKIIDQHFDCSVILISSRKFKNDKITTQLSEGVSVRTIVEVCRLALGRKISRNRSGFNPTEEVFLKALLQGASNKEMAREYDLPLSAVKYYLQKLYNKLGVKNRNQAALKAREIIV